MPLAQKILSPIRVAQTMSSRRRPYLLKTQEVQSSTNTSRQTILSPSGGYRIRIVRVKLKQHAADGRHLWELYFGTARNIITDQTKGIDILAVPNKGSDTTRTYLKSEGPRGNRGEVLSGRWRGTAPTSANTILIEYTEEP